MQGVHLTEQKEVSLFSITAVPLLRLGNVKSEGDLHFQMIKLMTACRMDWRGDRGGSRDASWEAVLLRVESEVQICDFDTITLNHFVILPFLPRTFLSSSQLSPVADRF